jgi:hypothetical protein
MPNFTIDLAAAKKQMFYDPSKPQEKVPDPLPENWLGTMSRGLPVREIPTWEYPKVVYLHPVRPFQEIEHRNNNFELVGTEVVPTEHRSKSVSCKAHKDGGPGSCADCKDALAEALAEGWTERPYLPQAPPKKDEDLYSRKKK